MQLLIDTATETPKSLLVASNILSLLAAELFIAEAGPQPSINGDGGEIKLTLESPPGQMAALEAALAAAKRPTPPPIGPAQTPGPTQPLPPGAKPVAPVVHPERHPDAPDVPAAQDPNVVFGRFSVPAGTNGPMAAPSSGVALDPTLPASCAAPDAPAAPAMNAGAVVAGGTLTAPPAPTTPAVSTAVSADRDKTGIPWDARVHSETRKTNADGTWRFRRNLDEVVKAAVMAELKHFSAPAASAVLLPPGLQPVNGLPGNVPLSPEAPPVPQQPAAANSLPAAPDAPVTLPGTLPMPAAHLVGVPDAPDPPVVPVGGFRQLMTKINVARANGSLKQEQMDAIMAAVGLDSITALAAQPALVPQVDQHVNHYIGAAA